MTTDARIKYPLRSDFFGGIGFRAASDNQRGPVVECRWSSSQIKRFTMDDAGLVLERLPPRTWTFSGTYNTTEGAAEIARLLALAYPVVIAEAVLPRVTLRADAHAAPELFDRVSALVMDMNAKYGEDAVLVLDKVL